MLQEFINRLKEYKMTVTDTDTTEQGCPKGYVESTINHCIDTVNKDNRHSVIMELACQLAEKTLVDKYRVLPEEMSNEDGEYHEKYQDEFNERYDHYMEILEQL